MCNKRLSKGKKSGEGRGEMAQTMYKHISKFLK
jgi:hypothetical protein